MSFSMSRLYTISCSDSKRDGEDFGTAGSVELHRWSRKVLLGMTEENKPTEEMKVAPNRQD